MCFHLLVPCYSALFVSGEDLFISQMTAVEEELSSGTQQLFKVCISSTQTAAMQGEEQQSAKNPEQNEYTTPGY